MVCMGVYIKGYNIGIIGIVFFGGYGVVVSDRFEDYFIVD